MVKIALVTAALNVLTSEPKPTTGLVSDWQNRHDFARAIVTTPDAFLDSAVWCMASIPGASNATPDDTLQTKVNEFLVTLLG